MAIGTYKLPICDGCKLPWLPVGWKQDSDPRNPVKPLRCGKCKSIGWDREFMKAEKNGSVGEVAYSLGPEKDAAVEKMMTLATKTPHARCKHRMTDCPLCKPKEAA